MLETFLRNELRPQLDLLRFQDTATYTTDFHASPKDTVSKQTHFSFQGHKLARPLA